MVLKHKRLAGFSVLLLLLSSACTQTSVRGYAIRLIEDDPTVLTISSRDVVRATGAWTVGIYFDSDSKCLHTVEAGPALLVDSSLIVWPRGTLPIQSDGRRGVVLPDSRVVFDKDTLRVRGDRVNQNEIPGNIIGSCRPGDAVLVELVEDIRR